MTSMKPVLLTAAIAAVMGGYSNTSSAETRPSLSGLQTQINQLKNGTTPVAPLIGNSTAACNTTTQGLLRWNKTDGQMELCDGAAWSAVMDEGHNDMVVAFEMICRANVAAGMMPGTLPSFCGDYTKLRYLPLGTNDEIIRDVRTGLEWQRCSVGQTWDGTTCTGTAGMFDWDTAITQTATGGFRIPTKDELKTLVYCSSGTPVTIGMTADLTNCSGSYTQPTIVQWAFPNTPKSLFWSGSPDAGSSSGAWGVGFGNGGAYDGYRDYYSHVRLVRGGQ